MYLAIAIRPHPLLPSNTHMTMGTAVRKILVAVELLSIINLLPIGESSGVPLVPRVVWCTFQVVEHDIHALWGCDGVRV